MNKPIDWATSRVEMLLVGIFGEDWRSRFGQSRKGIVVTNLGDNLLYRMAAALRETAQLGPRMHECNHPTDEAVCDKLGYLQVLEDCTREAELKWFWCTRCGALGSVQNLSEGAEGRFGGRRWIVEWRRPEAPLLQEPLVNGTVYRVLDGKLYRVVEGAPLALREECGSRARLLGSILTCHYEKGHRGLGEGPNSLSHRSGPWCWEDSEALPDGDLF